MEVTGITIKKRSRNNSSRVISIRIKNDTLDSIDKIAIECNYSRNELINLMLMSGIPGIRIG
ncbi:MAG: CopG family transcriptional regulator [Eubacteriales bacterium]|nr:CopG family transcriptional regulator [Eubacteriales bacterium]